jgi:hypothetical protein
MPLGQSIRQTSKARKTLYFANMAADIGTLRSCKIMHNFWYNRLFNEIFVWSRNKSLRHFLSHSSLAQERSSYNLEIRHQNKRHLIDFQNRKQIDIRSNVNRALNLIHTFFPVFAGLWYPANNICIS